MRTRASDAKLQKNEEAENALGEVMQQLGDEDKEGELSDSGDSDYEDEGAGAARPAKTSKGIVLRGNADEDSVASEGVDDSDEDAETEAGSSSGKDAEEMEVSSSNEESASSVSQKRNRKGHRKSPRKAARTATTLSPRDGSDAEDGAFVEGFPCRWSSWEDFHQSEEKPNLRIAVKCFQKHNPAWTDIRVLVTDKAMHEKAVLREAFPQARQLLCQWHVIMWLKKQATRLAASHKKEVKGLMKALVYSRNREEYQDAKYALLETLGGDVEHPMYKFFICNWDNTQEEWVSYKRGNIAHLGNNTNNRLECKWGKIKKVLEPHFTLDETILTLITLQRLAEDEYIAQYHEVGSRPHLGEDPELAALGMQLSEYAFTLVAEQHAFAVGPKADYGIDLSVPGKATLTRAGTGRLHVVDTSVRMQ
ncbi:hypothetical protein PRIC2_009639 [Phytophthora ramorum]